MKKDGDLFYEIPEHESVLRLAGVNSRGWSSCLGSCVPIYISLKLKNSGLSTLYTSTYSYPLNMEFIMEFTKTIPDIKYS